VKVSVISSKGPHVQGIRYYNNLREYMAWPEKLSHVKCVGFHDKFLPAIKIAIDQDMVEWGRASMFAEACSAPFRWAGCEWEMHESSETIWLISLTKGTPSSEDLTAAILRG
jgi:hypothetical protein